MVIGLIHYEKSVACVCICAANLAITELFYSTRAYSLVWCKNQVPMCFWTEIWRQVQVAFDIWHCTLYPCVAMVPAIIWVVTVVSLTQYWPGKLLDYWTLYCAYEITNFRSYMFPGTVPSQATGWCGAAFPADSPRFPEELQAGQVLCHLPRKRHRWRPPSGGWWSCTKGAWCELRCGLQKDQDPVQEIHFVVS